VTSSGDCGSGAGWSRPDDEDIAGHHGIGMGSGSVLDTLSG
jgi:hypothetical protein